jgi:predicted phage terminase large subunit-like protein
MWTGAKVQAVAEDLYHDARKYFWVYRRAIDPSLKWGWWAEVLSVELQEFYKNVQLGLRPSLAIMAPPQHGKSRTVEDFMCWAAGINPNLKIIFASHSDGLGEARNANVRRVLRSPIYQNIFPGTKIGFDDYKETSNFVEFVAHKGSFRNTTVKGSINGQGLDLGVLDDPVKDREEAQSEHMRDKLWEWFTDNWYGRFSETAGQLLIMTRWHQDDILGRFIERDKNCRVVSYPAIAEGRERFRKKGEALFPEMKSLEFLELRRQIMSEASWESEYQQNPIIPGGGIFPVDRISVRPFWNASYSSKCVRYWDKAGTEGGKGAYTAGVLMHKTPEKQYVVSDVARGRWGALDREDMILKCAKLDREMYGGGYEVVVEQEPGSGGKESAEATIRKLGEHGFAVYADKPGAGQSKEVRADPFAAQVQARNVSVVAGQWHREYLNELEYFPNGKYKDQVDASSGAFSRLTLGYSYNLEAMQ